MTQTIEKPPLGKCPDCGEQSLQSASERGEDDHGQLEADRDFCEKCGYDTGWCVGRC